MSIGWKTNKLFKVEKMPKKLKIYSLKIHKGAAISKEKTKTFFNKDTEHKNNYM